MSKTFILIMLFFIVIALILLIDLVIFIEPTSKLSNVLISNLTDKQATVSWTTDKTTRGTILISDNNRFPPVVIFAQKANKYEESSALQGFLSVHSITLTDLKPNTLYNYRIYQGIRAVYQDNFQTGPTLDQILTPHPVYGKVKDTKSNPVTGAIIYLQLFSPEGTQSALLSTLSNREGGWSIDLANARSTDLQESFTLDEKTREEIMVERGKGGRIKESTPSGKDQPWPDVILR
ncbi:hypothetical protein A3B42_01900 [Candidatus Daviesbacteria bacterium RIFCSPLOWO2_01_FULL_38_10]|nr:MAG: hypothetical protein A3D02_00170 [Candidatus Daviesbacteria bacterium RIFCSPHIGHO2_02_FULL_39_41]OGE29777.1 MAG: hypothetical protein A2772_00550 [Candidatus Daviesbacteria bacterium RIFCSPHIGHO2_01_FULL_38_8b]OGE40170.1 MAG: hypothetical protein A3B42_01900 [Candidatus Daviesbacteria bacterium RIFCSPLOWO2_01_FULL_38_10]OGE45482.1 MAG: hypothetical protein A3E67_03850 [Candidatus Daviesbacteria bacterium RIFCSPHIGHO2_12_FULL_38_25]OGE67568.1 MAG: hypothetical protein A3H81_00995 [Candid